jgi:hypothetical protein
MEELKRIQQELKAPKSLKNDFGGFMYRSAESIIEALKPLLKNENCQLILTDDIVECGGRVYIKATATLINPDKEKESCSSFAREPESKKGMDASQITGSASSYARKYALSGLFLLDDNRDADSENNATVAVITDEQSDLLNQWAAFFDNNNRPDDAAFIRDNLGRWSEGQAAHWIKKFGQENGGVRK